VATKSAQINGQLEVWSESGVGTEARVVDPAHPKDRRAGTDDETTADFAAESPGTAPLAQARGLDLIDDVGAVNTICLQINALRNKMAKHSTAAFVDGGNVAQVKPDWFSFGKRLNTAWFGPARCPRRTACHPP
jgi:hypothetical protein